MACNDESFMSVALELAARGCGAVEPNPPVGAVIVRDGVEIASGWHGRFGGPHAEIEALSAASQAGTDVRGATMYVTLEPCRHHGKTPPCTEAIISAGVARVVVAMLDPDEKVSGAGVRTLRQADLEVDVGICEAPARKLLRAYIKLRTTGRPWVVCKWAQTADGFLAWPAGATKSGEEARWVSGPQSRARVHELRGMCDGICVGVETVLADDPLLTNRSSVGYQPARVVLDSKLRLPLSSRLVGTVNLSPVIVATTTAVDPSRPQVQQLIEAGVEVLAVGEGRSGRVDIAALLDELGRRQWTRLLVEGGAGVLESIIGGGLADELIVFVAPEKVGEAPPDLPKFDIVALAAEMGLSPQQQQRFGEDVMLRYILGG